MIYLDKDITHLKANLKTWHALYSKEDLARAERMLGYMTELKKLKGQQK